MPDEPSETRLDTTRRMVRAYLVGLGIIAALTVGGFVLERNHVAREQRAAQTVGLAATQTQLVDEISVLLHRLPEYDHDRVSRHLERRLFAALDRLAANHRTLLHGDPEREISPAPTAIRGLLVRPPENIDDRLRRFAEAVAAVMPRLTLSARDAHPEVDRIVANARAQLIPMLERVMRAYERHSRRELRQLQRLQEMFLFAVLGTILAEIAFVFRPMADAVGADVDALQGAYDQLRRQNREDELTGIGNRRALMETLAEPPARSRAVLQVDLDHFKTVNDLHGHPLGDAVLVAVAEAMTGLVRADDRAFRLGGDEFVVVLDGDVSTATATARAEALIAEIDRRAPDAALAAGLAASVGIAVYPDTESEPERLLADADIALAEAKAAGRHRHRVFAPAMREPLETRREVEQAFRRALQGDELVLHFQPQLDLARGHVVGFEGLARWQRPDGDVWGADRFIPHVEDGPLVVEAAAVLTDRAVEMALQLRRRGLSRAPVGINVADLQLRDPAFADGLLRRLDTAGLPADALSVEVVERALVGRGQEQVAEQLRRLDEAGVRIELDDFGTGHASLTHLKTFPVHRIKLDRSFVAGIGRVDGDETIVRATIEIAESFGRRVIAEGVETDAQRLFLLAHGCDEGQGYLFAPPLPPSALLRWLDGRCSAATPRATVAAD